MVVRMIVERLAVASSAAFNGAPTGRVTFTGRRAPLRMLFDWRSLMTLPS
jgi:hypothetical protein